MLKQLSFQSLRISYNTYLFQVYELPRIHFHNKYNKKAIEFSKIRKLTPGEIAIAQKYGYIG